jgi:Glycosyl hydrolases family 16
MTVEQVEALIRKYLSTGMAAIVVLIGPATAPGTTAPGTTATPDEGTTAAAKYGWGTPDRQDDFSGDLSGWGLYEGPGHAGNGKRSPSAAAVANGVLTIRGDAQGTTEGMAWDNGKGQKYGRWEGRVKAPASDPTYNALLLLWPDAENFPMGGEIDFMEMTDNTRQSTNVFLHHGADNSQTQGDVKIDATQWHNWAVEWTSKGVTTYVDGKTWWHTDDTATLPPGPMHLCIQLDWFPKDGDGAVKPSQMQVDWVRQYPVDDSGAPQESTAKPKPTAREPVMRAVIRSMFGW